jgi:hypothetical protein
MNQEQNQRHVDTHSASQTKGRKPWNWFTTRDTVVTIKLNLKETYRQFEPCNWI